MRNYLGLLNKVLINGTLHDNRTGIPTVRTTGAMLEFNMALGFPADQGADSRAAVRWPFAGRNTVLEVEKFLRHNKMKLKESHHDGQARGSEGAPNQGEGAGGVGYRCETDPVDEALAAEVSG